MGLKIILKYGKPYRSRQQALVERYNWTISRAIARYQLVKEEVTGELNTEWIDYLPTIVKVLNQELVRENPMRNKNKGPTCRASKGDCVLLSKGDKVRVVLDKPIDTITGKRLPDQRWRIGDIRYSNTVYTIRQVILRSNQPPLYRLSDSKNTAYTRSQLLLANEETKPFMNIPEKFEIERFIGKKKIAGLVHYWVKWKGYPASQASWHLRKELLKDLGKKAMADLEADYQQRNQ